MTKNKPKKQTNNKTNKKPLALFGQFNSDDGY